MILVELQYFPSINYFKYINKNDILVNLDSFYARKSYRNRTIIKFDYKEMKKLTVLTVFLILLSFDTKAQVKIGYTNPEVILSQLPEVQAIDKEIGILLQKKDSLLAIQAIARKKEFDE